MAEGVAHVWTQTNTMKCFNCGAVGDHYSRHCPEPQRYTRCPSCRRVCHNEDAHYDACANKRFTSSEVNPMLQLVDSHQLIELGFLHVKEVTVRSTFDQKSITGFDLVEFVPKKIVIQKTDDRTYRFSSFPISGGAGESLCYHRNVHILIYDQFNDKRFHIFVAPDSTIINGQIFICQDHVLKGAFNLPPPHHQIELAVTTLSQTAHKFGLLVKVFGKSVGVFEYKAEPTLHIYGEGW